MRSRKSHRRDDFVQMGFLVREEYKDRLKMIALQNQIDGVDLLDEILTRYLKSIPE